LLARTAPSWSGGAAVDPRAARTSSGTAQLAAQVRYEQSLGFLANRGAGDHGDSNAPSMPANQAYRKLVQAKIRAQIEVTTQSRPIFFAGAGLSRRYLNTPGWYALLVEVLTLIGDKKGLDFYLQKTDKSALDDDLIEVADIIAELAHEWAWSEAGRQYFEQHLYQSQVSYKVFFKRMVARIIGEHRTISADYADELAALKAMDAKEIVTTNYDNFLSEFLGYCKHNGRRVNKPNGEGVVLHAHGSIDDPDGIIILPSDYKDFSITHRYSFAKLLVYFIEDPCVFIGYSLSDPHIKQLIVDAAEATTKTYLPNVFLVSWSEQDGACESVSEPYLVEHQGRYAKINLINTPDFGWIYQSFPQKGDATSVATAS
jgi:hypothetical protein